MRDELIEESLPPETDPFQNRKRYGCMRDWNFVNMGAQIIKCFKTVNGMDACATTIEIKHIDIDVPVSKP